MQLTTRQRIGFYNHLFKALRKNDHTGLIRHLKPYLPENATIFDVGGHAGQFAKLFAHMCPAGHVFTFEPSLYARSILQIMVGLKFLPNVYVLPFGLTYQAGTALIHTPVKKRRSLGYGLAFIGDRQGDNGTTISHKILLSTIDETCRALGLTQLDFIKADIEGSEMNMLQGAHDTIARFKPTVMLEINNHHLQRNGHTSGDIFRFFEQMGYAHVYKLDAPAETLVRLTDTEKSDASGDFLFVAS